MAIRRELLTPTLLDNTVMNKVFINDVHELYEITPNEGYVLHDNSYDIYAEYDENGNGIGDVILGYRTSTASCTVAQFNNNTYEFYAVPASSVPADQIFGDVTPDTEVMK